MFWSLIMVARPHRSPLPPRWPIAALALSLVACQSDRVVDAPEAQGRPHGDAPTVNILYPRGGSFNGATYAGCDSVEVGWEGDDGSGSDAEIVGYQVKLFETFGPNTTTLGQIVWMATSAESHCEDDDDYLHNLLIPDSLIVSVDVPTSDSTFHPCDWYPKATSPLAGDTFMIRDLPQGWTAFVVRAVDTSGNVTPPEGYAFCREDEEGNVLQLKNAGHGGGWGLRVYDRIYPRHWDFIFPGIDTIRTFAVPAGYPLDFDWSAGRGICGPPASFEYAYAIDIPDPECATCTDPDGIGGWTPWGSDVTEIPSLLVFGEEADGETHTVHIKVRDLGFLPDAVQIVRISFEIFVPEGFQRPALWVDDFATESLDDCAHDALVGPWLDDAVRPYIRVQEGIARWIAHPPGDDPCVELDELRVPTLEDLLRFRMLFWNVRGTELGTALGEVTAPPSYVPATMALEDYVRWGGGVVVWGRNTIGALLGDTYLQDSPYEPELPQFSNPDFGPGTFLWDMAQFRTMFDTVGRGTSQRLSQACSGIVGLEATETAIAEGYPVGVLDPSGYSTDPTNTTVTPRTAIWYDRWEGRRNPFGTRGDVASGPPSLHVEGLDTLYVCAANSWSYLEDGTDAIRDVCGTSFPSSFEGKPIVMRYDDPIHGRVVWIGTELTDFAENHSADIELILAKLIEWVLEEGG
jgi:hypothetical protein